jgi:hypothetical protein
MTQSTLTATQSSFDYTATAAAILAALRNERDRQIVAQRYGLGLPKRHTLEKIGSDFGITRERVRQIEKAATAKLKDQPTPELKAIDGIFRRHLSAQGDIGLLDDVASAFGATTPAQRAYITFLATLAPNIELIEEGDHYHAAVALLPNYDRQKADAYRCLARRDRQRPTTSYGRADCPHFQAPGRPRPALGPQPLAGGQPPLHS